MSTRQERHAAVKAADFGASAQGGSGWTISGSLAREGAEIIVSARSLEGVAGLPTRSEARAMRCGVADGGNHISNRPLLADVQAGIRGKIKS